MIDRPQQKRETLSDKIDSAFELVAQEVISRAKRTGTEVVFWRDNQIVRLTPEQAAQELAAKNPRSSN